MREGTHLLTRMTKVTVNGGGMQSDTHPRRHTLSGNIGKVVASYAEGCRVDTRQRLHRFILCTRRSEYCQRGCGVPPSQLDLPSLTPLSVAGCGRLKLGVAH